MIFEYDDVKYTGTREQILSRLKSNIIFLNLEWIGHWKIGTTILMGNQTPSYAREELTKMILDLVPQELTACLTGNYVNIYENGDFVKKVNIYDI